MVVRGPALDAKPEASKTTEVVTALTEMPGGWHVAVKREKQGPLSHAEVAGLIESRALTNRSYAWRAGMESWERLEDIKLFRPNLESIAARSAAETNPARPPANPPSATVEPPQAEDDVNISNDTIIADFQSMLAPDDALNTGLASHAITPQTASPSEEKTESDTDLTSVTSLEDTDTDITASDESEPIESDEDASVSKNIELIPEVTNTLENPADDTDQISGHDITLSSQSMAEQADIALPGTATPQPREDTVSELADPETAEPPSVEVSHVLEDVADAPAALADPNSPSADSQTEELMDPEISQKSTDVESSETDVSILESTDKIELDAADETSVSALPETTSADKAPQPSTNELAPPHVGNEITEEGPQSPIATEETFVATGTFDNTSTTDAESSESPPASHKKSTATPPPIPAKAVKATSSGPETRTKQPVEAEANSEASVITGEHEADTTTDEHEAVTTTDSEPSENVVNVELREVNDDDFDEADDSFFSEGELQAAAAAEEAHFLPTGGKAVDLGDLVPPEIEEPSRDEAKQLAQEFSLMVQLNKNKARNRTAFVLFIILVAGAVTALLYFQNKRVEEQQRIAAERRATATQYVPPDDEEQPTYAVPANQTETNEQVGNSSARTFAVEVALDAEPESESEAKKSKKPRKKGARRKRTASNETMSERPKNVDPLSGPSVVSRSFGKSEAGIALKAGGSTSQKSKSISDDAISRLISRRMKKFTTCKRRNAMEAMKVRLKFTVEASGVVTDVTVKIANGEDKFVQGCVRNFASKWRFPPQPEAKTFRRTLLL
jgi:TonB family protein